MEPIDSPDEEREESLWLEDEWLSCAEAISLLQGFNSAPTVMAALLSRLGAGLVRAHASRIGTQMCGEDHFEDNKIINRKFWNLELRADFQADWLIGDFQSRRKEDDRFLIKAYDVYFFKSDIIDMITNIENIETPKTKPKRRGGSDFREQDQKLIPQLDQYLKSGRAKNVKDAALILITEHNIPGKPLSTAKRLGLRYNEWLSRQTVQD